MGNWRFTMLHKKRNGFTPRFTVFTIVLFIGLLSITVLWYYKSNQVITNQVIQQDIQTLQKIFESIHKSAHIRGFDHEKNNIDFLTVRSFVGSGIGPMNLTYPEGWHGPYVDHTMMIQHRPYVVFCHKQGVFIIPADGVTLSNGFIIGKDIIFDQKTDMDQFLKSSDINWAIARIPVISTWTNVMMNPSLMSNILD